MPFRRTIGSGVKVSATAAGILAFNFERSAGAESEASRGGGACPSCFGASEQAASARAPRNSSVRIFNALSVKDERERIRLRPALGRWRKGPSLDPLEDAPFGFRHSPAAPCRSEEHTSELQSRQY